MMWWGWLNLRKLTWMWEGDLKGDQSDQTLQRDTAGMCQEDLKIFNPAEAWPTNYRNALHLAGDWAYVLPVSGLCVGYTQPGGPADGQRQVGLTGGAEQQGGAVQVVPEVAGHSCDDVLKVQGRKDLEKGPEIELNVFFQFSRSIDMSVTRSTVDWFVRSDLFLTFVNIIILYQWFDFIRK